MRSTVPGLVAVAIMCAAVTVARSDQSARDDPLAARLRADVEALADGIGPRSVFQGDSLARAAAHVEKELRDAGWNVTRETYKVGEVECANVVAERTGTTAPAEIVVVGAHYDSVPQSPGADDNGSGVAALLALARELRELAPARTLRLVAFANEEPIYFQTDLMGSRVYARGCKARGETIVGMASLESIGYFRDEKGSQEYPFPLSLFYPSIGNFVAVVGNWESRKLTMRVTRVLRGTDTIPVERAALPDVLPGIGWSDHWAFWQEGYPAVMITGTAIFRNPNYHLPSDRPNTLDYARLAATVRGVKAVVVDLVAPENP